MKIHQKSRLGFTLLEVAMVLLVGGLMLSAGASAMHSYMEQARSSVTRSRMQAIDDALNEYRASNLYYPCPASFIAAPDGSGYGVEMDRPTCADDTNTPAGTSSHNVAGSATVRIGAVPTRTLDLGDEFMDDGWGNRFTYAISQDLTSVFDPTKGVIKIVDSAGGPVASEVFLVIISHGKDGIGAYTHEGQPGRACPNLGTNPEARNCQFFPKTSADNATDTFTKTTKVSTRTGSANVYDDYVTYRSAAANTKGYVYSQSVMFYDGATCPPGWQLITITGVAQTTPHPEPENYILCRRQ